MLITLMLSNSIVISAPVGGYCSDSDSCICNVGYTGDNCTIGRFFNWHAKYVSTDYLSPYVLLYLRGTTDLDPCGNNTPCENGATCNNTGPDQYECLCAAGFEGDSCERETNECDPNPCMNGGNCQVSAIYNGIATSCQSV